MQQRLRSPALSRAPRCNPRIAACCSSKQGRYLLIICDTACKFKPSLSTAGRPVQGEVWGLTCSLHSPGITCMHCTCITAGKTPPVMTYPTSLTASIAAFAGRQTRPLHSRRPVTQQQATQPRRQPLLHLPRSPQQPLRQSSPQSPAQHPPMVRDGSLAEMLQAFHASTQEKTRH